MENASFIQHKTRRTYSKRFKAELVARYLSGDESIAAIALEHDINANLLHNWITQNRRYGMHDLAMYDEPNEQTLSVAVANNNWLPILPTSKPSTTQKQPKRTLQLNNDEANLNDATPNTCKIDLSIKSGDMELDLQWPSTDHTGLAKFVKELMA